MNEVSMPFRLFVKNAARITTLQRCLIDVVIESGEIKGHEKAMVEGTVDRHVVLNGAALVGGGTGHDVVTFSIESPSFPIEELVGRRLLSEEESCHS